MGRLIQLALIPVLAMQCMQSSADDQDRALELRNAGEILPLEEILSIGRTQIEGRILEVELEREDGMVIYELEILDKQGRVWEMKIDAAAGKIIKQEME